MNTQTSIRMISTLQEFEEVRDVWNLLLEKQAHQTIFLTWEWLYAWWKHNQQGKSLWLVTAWQGTNLVGAAPLMFSKTRKHGMTFRFLQTLGTPNTDHSDFVTTENDPAIVEALCRHILSKWEEWDAIELNEHLEESPTTQVVTRLLKEAGLVTKVRSNLHYHIPIVSTWDEYFKGLSKNMRREIEKSLRHAKEKHAVELKRFCDNDVTWENFETFFEVNKNGSYPEKYKSETEKAFHRELFELMREKGWIEIALLYFDGIPAAYEYGFKYAGRFEDWRTGYDRRYAESSAGKILLILLMKDFFDHGYADFDFLRGEYEHKDRWRPDSRKYLNITAVRPASLKARFALLLAPAIWHWLKEHIPNKQGSHNST